MENQYGIDSHKLMYHPGPVAAFQNDELVAPISVEVSLSGGCNHRCTFCSMEHLGYKAVFIDKGLLIDNLKVLADKGLKSAYFAGSGEPLLHKDFPDIFNEVKAMDVDVALATNGVLLTREKAEKFLHSMSWIRFSFNAINSETYQHIHGCPTGDLEKVLKNIEDAVKIKKAKNLDVTIGIQAVLIDENYAEIVKLVKTVKDLGVDYFTLKSLGKDDKIATKTNADFTLAQLQELEDELNALKTLDFNVIVRIRTMVKRLKKEKREFNRCYALPFSFILDAEGGLWACCAHVGDKKFYYGNIKDGLITDSPEVFFNKTKELSQTQDISGCILGCRFEYMNEYLHKFIKSPTHVNFI